MITFIHSDARIHWSSYIIIIIYMMLLQYRGSTHLWHICSYEDTAVRFRTLHPCLLQEDLRSNRSSSLWSWSSLTKSYASAYDWKSSWTESKKFLKNRQLPIFELQMFLFFLANYKEKCKSAFHWLLYASNPCVAQIYKEQNSGKVGKSKWILSKFGRINSDFCFFDGETKLTKENCTCWLVTGQ